MGETSEDAPAGRPVRRRPTRAQTRRRVLDAALAVFGEQGIQGGSLDAVAEAGQLSKGAIYSNFTSKTDLVLALVRENTLNRVGLGLEAVSHAESPHDALTILSEAMTRALKDDQVRHRLVAELYILAHRDPELAETLKIDRIRARAAGAETLRRGAELLGITLPMPAEHLIVVLIALHNGFTIERASTTMRPRRPVRVGAAPDGPALSTARAPRRHGWWVRPPDVRTHHSARSPAVGRLPVPDCQTRSPFDTPGYRIVGGTRPARSTVSGTDESTPAEQSDRA